MKNGLQPGPILDKRIAERFGVPKRDYSTNDCLALALAVELVDRYNLLFILERNLGRWKVQFWLSDDIWWLDETLALTLCGGILEAARIFRLKRPRRSKQ